MTFRVGQKVVCINDTPLPGKVIYGLIIPRKGGIYTIVGFRACRRGDGLILDIDPDWQYLAWRFRPVVERQTSISIFTQMLAPSRRKETV